jgi:two-component system sensor histidine kinase TctE
MSSIRLRLLRWLIPPVLLMNLAAGALAWMLAPPHLREAVLRTLVLVEMVFALACVGWCGSRSAMACSR